MSDPKKITQDHSKSWMKKKTKKLKEIIRINTIFIYIKIEMKNKNKNWDRVKTIILIKKIISKSLISKCKTTKIKLINQL